jgi:hypothetical protein
VATTVFLHPQSLFYFDAVVGAPNATYLAGHSVMDTEIYRLDVTDASGALDPAVLSGTITGEVVDAMIQEGGRIVLATHGSDGNGRIRVCEIEGGADFGGALSIGPNIFSQLGQQPAGEIRSLHSDGRFIYFSWPNLDSSSTGCGRLDLQTAVQPLVFAYATDQMAPTQGDVNRVYFDNASDQVWLVVAGVGLYGTVGPTSYMDTNYLDSGRIRFGLIDPKVFARLELRCLPRPGTSITILVTNDQDLVDGPYVYSDGGPGPVAPFELNLAPAEWVDLRISLTATVAGLAPQLTWYKLGAVPLASSAEQVIVSIILRDEVRADPSDQAPVIAFNVEEEIAYLTDLARNRKVVVYQTGSTIETLYVNNLEQKPDRWDYGNRHLEGIANVELRTMGG